MKNSTRRHGFTLVELLVVIGIIALLISILLPSLNKARQQANQLDCQARLRTMGQALSIYLVQSKSSLPWGVVDRSVPWSSTTFTPSDDDREYFNWWMFTLSEVMNKTARDAQGNARISPIFRDKDTIESTTARYVNHYTANPRVLYQANAYDSAPAVFSSFADLPEQPQDRRQRKLGNIKKTAAVFVIWDGPQCWSFDFNSTTNPVPTPDQEYNVYPLASAIDSWGMDNTTALCFDAPSTSNQYGRASLPGPGTGGLSGVTDGRVLQSRWNKDFQSVAQWMGMRFRHMGNTSLAALCLDGHVETRKVGTLMRGDIFTNYK